MKKLAALTLSLFLAVGTVLADTPKDATPQAAKTAQKAKPRAAAKQADKSAEIAAQIEELRKSLQSQQEQIQQLKNELARRDQQITDVRNAAAAADSKASEAAAKATAAVASTAEAKTASSTLVSDVNDLKLGSETLKVAVQDTQKKIISAESPSTIHYKGVNLTPGGFIEAATVFRQRATSSDINTPFNTGQSDREQLHRQAIPPHVAGRNHDWQRQGDWLLRRRFPRGRHHFQQPPEQQLCLPPAAIVGQRYLGERFPSCWRPDVELGDGE